MKHISMKKKVYQLPYTTIVSGVLLTATPLSMEVHTNEEPLLSEVAFTSSTYGLPNAVAMPRLLNRLAIAGVPSGTRASAAPREGTVTSHC